jgi:putative ABC transport system permease protein
MFKSYFTIAWRNLKRNKIYSTINVMGLSLGLACAMLIILYALDELSYDRFHANTKNIYRITSNRINPDGSIAFKSTSSGIFQGPRFTANIPEIQSYVRMQGAFRDMKLGREIVGRELFLVDPAFFTIFSFPLKAGNAKTALDDPQSIVISEKLAKEQFGNSNAMGKIIEIKKGDAFQPYVVTGVAPESPQNSSIRFDILLPLEVTDKAKQDNDNWLNFHLNTFVLLSDKADITAVERKMKAVFDKEAGEALKEFEEAMGNKTTFEQMLQPLLKLHLDTEYQANNGLKDASKPIYSYILSGIALFILLIACINFVNLTIARSLKRAKEIGIRKVVGGERKQLIVQFLGESFLLCAVAFLLAILLVQLALPTFNQLANKVLSLSYLLDARVVAGYFALFIITALMAGFYPALVLSGFKPVKVLYSRFNLSGKNYLQKSLVVLQFSLATLLIVATFAIYAQFSYLTGKDLGYDDTNVVFVENSNMKHGQANLLREALLSNPNILAVGLKNGGREGTMARVNNTKEMGFDFETIDAGYLPLYKIPIIKGRNFSPEFPGDSTRSMLVNETFARKAGWADPLGQVIDFYYKNEKFTVVGVVKDYHYRSLNEEIGAQVFTLQPKKDYGLACIKIKPNSETVSLQHIEATFKKIFPLSPYVYKFKDLENARSYEAEAKWKQMMLFGAILTIFISSIGLFGLSVLSAEKRKKEIGIRKVLGASVSGVVTTLSKDFLKLVTIAMLVAMPAAWYFANQWLQNYAYRITLHWPMFAVAGVLVIFIALATVSFQAFKAAMSNPVKALRSE